MRAADARDAAAGAPARPTASGSAMLGSTASPQRHYPDLMLDIAQRPSCRGRARADRKELAPHGADHDRLRERRERRRGRSTWCRPAPSRGSSQTPPGVPGSPNRACATDRARRDRRASKANVRRTRAADHRRPPPVGGRSDDRGSPSPALLAADAACCGRRSAFAALLLLPAWVALAVAAAAVTARFVWRDVRHVRARDAEIAGARGPG